MIKKQFRLKQREVKKVLGKTKPLFSNGIVLNQKQNRKNYNRFAIIIGAKSVTNNVTRNFFRRRFFDIIKESKLYGLALKSKKVAKNGESFPKYYDFVFLVKKQTKLDKKDIKTIKNFKNDLNFLIKKVK